MADLITDLKGVRLMLRHCEGNPMESWNEAIAHVQKDPVRCIAQMKTRQQQLVNTGTLRSPDHFRKEGKLPDKSHFYAIKAGKIRAYGWFSNKHSGVFFVSHYRFKGRETLNKLDTNRVCANWRDIEETK